jgi:hypothetical protein
MRDELAYHGAGKLPGGILESLDFLVNLQVAGIRETATLDGWSAILPYPVMKGLSLTCTRSQSGPSTLLLPSPQLTYSEISGDPLESY